MKKSTLPWKGIALAVFVTVSLCFVLSTCFRSACNQYLSPYAYYVVSLAAWGLLLYLVCRAEWKNRAAKWGILALCSLCLALYPTIFGKLCSPYHWHHLFPSSCMLYKVDTTQPLVGLTFDGGPIPGKTEQLLKVLKKHHAHATFFLMGKNLPGNEAIVQNIIEHGHTLGNHTWSHPRACDVSNEEFTRELQKTNKALASITGKPNTLMRPPGGILDPYQGWVVTQQQKYLICMWSVQANDTVYLGEDQADTIVPRMVQVVRPGDIILMHDYAMAPETLDTLLTELGEKGLRGVSIQELVEAARK